ncbi:hypothetical protein JCGZ_14066 [Jatropha curcas]|uniref:Secreted protein n=1 Tax=Jatropha curcas TaxID=180498 RepID=A0A067K7R0_JATCU|nr:hypothetical protein JCGZ_14066 [Jatropha curcas]
MASLFLLLEALVISSKGEVALPRKETKESNYCITTTKYGTDDQHHANNKKSGTAGQDFPVPTWKLAKFCIWP